MTIRTEVDQDRARVREVHARAFGDGERVPDLVDALRALPVLSFVAESGGQVVGHVMLSRCRLDAPSRLVDVMSLSPLGVLPEHQGQGLGTALIEYALAAAEESGVPLVFLEGSPAFYGKRGFERADEAGFRSPSLRIPPAAFQVVKLRAYEEWMSGTFVYSDPFWAFDCVGLR